MVENSEFSTPTVVISYNFTSTLEQDSRVETSIPDKLTMSLSFRNILVQSFHTSMWNTQQTFGVRLCSIGAVNQRERCGREFLVAPTYN